MHLASLPTRQLSPWVSSTTALADAAHVGWVPVQNIVGTLYARVASWCKKEASLSIKAPILAATQQLVQYCRVHVFE